MNDRKTNDNENWRPDVVGRPSFPASGFESKNKGPLDVFGSVPLNRNVCAGSFSAHPTQTKNDLKNNKLGDFNCKLASCT